MLLLPDKGHMLRQWSAKHPLCSVPASSSPPQHTAATASLSARRAQMASFCFSSRHTAEKQGSVPAQQSESSVPSVKCGARGHCIWGLLHENTFLLLSPWSSCHFPTSSVSFLAAAAVHLFIFNASRAEDPSLLRVNAVIFSGAGLLG